jgi:hypothetical protein
MSKDIAMSANIEPKMDQRKTGACGGFPEDFDGLESSCMAGLQRNTLPFGPEVADQGLDRRYMMTKVPRKKVK